MGGRQEAKMPCFLRGFCSLVSNECSAYRAQCVAVIVPETSNEPFDRLDRRHESQTAAHETEECLDMLVEFGILRLCKLVAILVLAFFAEDCQSEVGEAFIELTELLETLRASRKEGLVCLGGGYARFPDQRLGMRRPLSFDTQCRL